MDTSDVVRIPSGGPSLGLWLISGQSTYMIVPLLWEFRSTIIYLRLIVHGPGEEAQC
jgi:hypothetical protein